MRHHRPCVVHQNVFDNQIVRFRNKDVVSLLFAFRHNRDDLFPIDIGTGQIIEERILQVLGVALGFFFGQTNVLAKFFRLVASDFVLLHTFGYAFLFDIFPNLWRQRGFPFRHRFGKSLDVAVVLSGIQSDLVDEGNHLFLGINHQLVVRFFG